MQDIPNFKTEKEMFDSEALLVYQKGFSITDSNSEITKLGTGGLGPCVGISFYDPETTTLIVAHFDALTKIEESISTLATWINSKGKLRNTEVNIVQGIEIPKSQVLLNNIQRVLHQWGIQNTKYK